MKLRERRSKGGRGRKMKEDGERYLKETVAIRGSSACVRSRESAVISKAKMQFVSRS